MKMLLMLGLLTAVSVQGKIVEQNSLTDGNSAAGVPKTFESYPSNPATLTGERKVIQTANGPALFLRDTGTNGEIGFFKKYYGIAKPGEHLRATVEAALPEGEKWKSGEVFYIQLTFIPGWKKVVRTAVVPQSGKFQVFTVKGIVPPESTGAALYIYSHRQPTGAILVRNIRLEVSPEPFAEPAEVRTDTTVRLNAPAARLSGSAKMLKDSRFDGGFSLQLKNGITEDPVRMDARFKIRAPKAGRYQLIAKSALDPAGKSRLDKAAVKQDSLMIWLSLDGSVPTRRMAFPVWEKHRTVWNSILGNFDFTGDEQELAVSLPAGLQLGALELRPYFPPAVPDKAASYTPYIVPGKEHPRIWATPETLAQIRANLTVGENLAVWNWVKQQAAQPYHYRPDLRKEAEYEPRLQDASMQKAFVYLMTGEKKYGSEAIELQRVYLSRVSFGNMLDITRNIGSAIYAGSLVYDWCYPLLTAEDRVLFRKHLLRLAEDMEIGWPPFKQQVVNGHGNEAQVNRDLLSMGIALYGDDDEPYRLCAYRLLEEVIPMRRWEYASPRHSQGINYGSYRFGWEMHAAWMLRRMCGKPVYPDNLREVGNFFLYARLPDGTMLPDGDQFSKYGSFAYPLTAFMIYTYMNDPVMKGEYLQQTRTPPDRILYLLLNDPGLPAQPSKEELPLARDTGDILGSLTMRTGWSRRPESGNVVVEMRGGGFHFGGHQYAASGAFQIYYRGFQTGDIAQYHFYGTPYDYDFAKRSVSKNLVLVRTAKNPDGSQRLILGSPSSLQEVLSRPDLCNGKVLAADFGPSAKRPLYGIFSADLTAAYPGVLKSGTRNFIFLNLDNTGHPAALLIRDRMVSLDPAAQKYFQLCTIARPREIPGGIRTVCRTAGQTGKMFVQMFRPTPEERTMKILGGTAELDVFGKKYQPPYPDMPDGKPYRTLISPKKAQSEDFFITAITLADGGQKQLPVQFAEDELLLKFELSDWLAVMPKNDSPVNTAFELNAQKNCKMLITGLTAGNWTVQSPAGKCFRAAVRKRSEVIFLEAGPGKWKFAPGALETLPPLPESSLQASMVDKTTSGDGLLPLASYEKTFQTAGVTAVDKDGKLVLRTRTDEAVLENGKSACLLNGFRLEGKPAARQTGDGWLLSPDFAADFARSSLHYDDDTDLPVFLPRTERSPDYRVFRFVSALPDSQEKFRTMLTDPFRRTGYWAAPGRNVQFEIVLFRPEKLNGVAIRWLQGSRRKADFRLEVSGDGRTYETVFDGKSSGKTDQFEEVKFPARPVLRIRFTGRGNSDNYWNSITAMRLLDERSGTDR